MTRYCYHSKQYREAGAPFGLFCDPVLKSNGKFVIDNGHQLVEFEDGAQGWVIARALRLRSKCKEHGGQNEGSTNIQS